jgi:DNA-binding LacI/PurR family transcriptional regulator
MDIRAVAKRAAVSTATVSRTVNRNSTVTPALARRVWKAVRELGYYPNTQARGLVSGRSRIFGLIVSDLTNPFFPEIVQVFETLAVQHHYEILLASTMNDREHMKSSVRRMLERRVEGVAIVTFGMEEVLLEDFKLREVPVVLVDVVPTRRGVSTIRVDYLNGIRQAVQHLAALRHRNIAFISGPRNLDSAAARQQAFLQSMEEIGLRPDPRLIVEGNHTLEGGHLACAGLLSGAHKPSAIVCSNDLTAMGVMRRSYELGIQIPGDLSVIGFDDIRLAQFCLPPLTTVQMSQSELARLAFHSLLTEVGRKEESARGTEYELKTTLVLRKSTSILGPGD